METSQVVVGFVYTDDVRLERYVISITPSIGRRSARVQWRRPGAYASNIYDDTIGAFARCCSVPVYSVTVYPARFLPNDGMAVVS